MTPSAQMPRHLPDRLIRTSLQEPDNLRDLLHAAVPDLAGGFVYEQARLLEREFVQEDWRRREADLPFEIPYRTAEGLEPTLVCVLIEHQSDTDPFMPLRLLLLAADYWDRQWQTWQTLERPRPAFHLCPVLPVVLYTGPLPWGSNRSLADLLGEPAAFHAFTPTCAPLFWNLADHGVEALLASGAPWLQMLAVLRAQQAPRQEFARVFTETVERLARLSQQQQLRWYELTRMALSLAGFRRPAEERAALAALVARANPQRPQEVQNMEKTIADVWFEETVARSLAEGRAQGMAEGRAEGERAALRRTLRHFLSLRFDPLPEAVVQRIEQCTDVEKLTAAIERTSQMQSLDELQL